MIFLILIILCSFLKDSESLFYDGYVPFLSEHAEYVCPLNLSECSSYYGNFVTLKRAVDVCEEDPECAGFSFTGATVMDRKRKIHFFR